ncbi:helix-turn-helix domain-containing protein [Yokenella regensburgei]|uniref:helix-turn-helix domain-containing protein n=1 Tax=Enterobacteriaceae TaxID=543 RepID=UPI0024A8331D|nr:helix-turn-helix transcriptional regulator [Klebsiella pneumoniae]HDO7154518.1 helix-turn-helix transcriptional regulator [Klebsiella pneumoniae]
MVPRRLKAAREAAGLSQEKLAELIGIDGANSRSRLSNYEVGRFSPPFDVIVRIAKVLNYPEYYFYVIDDDIAEMLLHHHQSDHNAPLMKISAEVSDRESKKLRTALDEAVGMAERLTQHLRNSSRK